VLCGLFSLLSADHTPPSFSPCTVISAHSFSFLTWACIFSRCSSLFASIISVVLSDLSMSKSGCWVMLCRSFCRRIMWEGILWYVSLLWFFAMVLMSFLYWFHRSCGLVMFRSGCSHVVFSISVWSFIPLLITAWVSVLFFSDAVLQVHLPLPIYGASKGANFTKVNQ